MVSCAAMGVALRRMCKLIFKQVRVRVRVKVRVRLIFKQVAPHALPCFVKLGD